MVRANMGSARYNFTVSSGATISAEYCNFRNIGASGLNIASGASVDPAHTFTGCTFQDGAAGGTLLTIKTDATRFSIYPNPTSGLFTLTRQTQGIAEILEIEIFTINRDKVLKTTLNERSSGTFDFRREPSGIYLIKIMKSHFIEVKKLIIN